MGCCKQRAKYSLNLLNRIFFFPYRFMVLITVTRNRCTGVSDEHFGCRPSQCPISLSRSWERERQPRARIKGQTKRTVTSASRRKHVTQPTQQSLKQRQSEQLSGTKTSTAEPNRTERNKVMRGRRSMAGLCVSPTGVVVRPPAASQQALRPGGLPEPSQVEQRRESRRCLHSAALRATLCNTLACHIDA